MYQWSWASEMSAETWFILHFVTMVPLVVGLVFCLSRGSRNRAAFLALSYNAYLAAYMAICSLLMCRKDLALSEVGRLLAIWIVVGAFNFAFVFLVARRAALCNRQSSWGLPTLAVGSLFALVVASGMWPISLIDASRADLAIFALATLAAGVTISALCHPSHDNAHVAKNEAKKEEPNGEKEKCEVGEQNREEPKPRVEVAVEIEERNLTTGAAEPLADGGCRGETPRAPQSQDNADPMRGDHGGPGVSALPQHNEAGEALFNEARAIPHQPIPDFDCDGPYLELLGKSAAAGYAPALAKLGEYAMRRDAWVEAYYWMTLAKRNGMRNLSATLRAIRRAWSEEDFPDQSENVNVLFTLEAGSIGRALLHIDSGHDAAAARQFLKECHPEFLREKTNR